MEQANIYKKLKSNNQLPPDIIVKDDRVGCLSGRHYSYFRIEIINGEIKLKRVLGPMDIFASLVFIAWGICIIIFGFNSKAIIKSIILIGVIIGVAWGWIHLLWSILPTRRIYKVLKQVLQMEETK